MQVILTYGGVSSKCFLYSRTVRGEIGGGGVYLWPDRLLEFSDCALQISTANLQFTRLQAKSSRWSDT